MRRVFPTIVILITLSVFGILFIQMQWISNAMQVRRDQFEQWRQAAMRQIQNDFGEEFMHKVAIESGTSIYEPSARKQFIVRNFTANKFTDDEVAAIIRNALRAQNIKEPFEYAITDIFQSRIRFSPGFAKLSESDSSSNVLSLKLTSESAGQDETLYLYVAEPKNYLIRRMGWMIGASVLLTGLIVAAFSLTLRTMLNQKKLSEIKSDFINNMTHEFKTPLATISLAVDALKNEKVIHNPDQIGYYSGMIKEENRRMNKQVETILQAARIERQEIQLNLQALDAHATIRKVADTLALQVQEKGGTLHLKLAAQRPTVLVDDVHFSNIVFNLLDNAFKYAKPTDPPRIDIETANTGNYLAIRIRDNGIGMNKETQGRVFEKFYRAHTGNLHNVKGFGLGLSYVKAMTEAQSGKIRVESALGKGSTFTVQFPLA